MKKFLLVISVFIFLAPVSRAESDNPLPFVGVEFITGFGYSELRQEQGIYNVIPFFVDFDFDLKPFAEKFNIRTPGLLQLVEEPFLNYASRPNNNIETGNNIALKFGFAAQTAKLQPYIKAGAGIIYLTQHVLGQSTQLNFNEFAGLGCHCFISENTALTVEYRFRHLSNASIDLPNSGLDTHFVIFGIAYRF